MGLTVEYTLVVSSIADNSSEGRALPLAVLTSALCAA